MDGADFIGIKMVNGNVFVTEDFIEGVSLKEILDRRIALTEKDAGREAAITGPQPAVARIARSLAMRDFLDRFGWRGAHRAHLTGDASARSYETVNRAGRDTARPCWSKCSRGCARN